MVRAFPLAGPSSWGPERGKNDALVPPPPPARSNKNHKKCDEMVKNRDEMVTGAVFRVEKAGRSGDTAGRRRLLSRRHQAAGERRGAGLRFRSSLPYEGCSYILLG